MNSDSSRAQVAFYKEKVDVEEEITRPRGYPPFVRWLIGSKVDAAVRLYAPGLHPGMRVLVVCAGSGLDLEMLSDRGLVPVGLDLSLEATKRAKERARRFGARYRLACGDATVLPFPDGAFDVVFVHDGLHHLKDPYVGAAEMLRVARRAVVIAEPAVSPLTRLAVWLGISGDHEEAGNYVYRIDPHRLAQVTRDFGFTELRVTRELCYYQPWTYTLYSVVEGIFGMTALQRMYRSINRLIGRWGNSLRVAAWRPDGA